MWQRTRPAQSTLSLQDLWCSPFRVIRPGLLGASHLLSAWGSEARQLSLDWTHGIDSGGHFWQGAAFCDDHVEALQARVEQVSGCDSCAGHARHVRSACAQCTE